jgi:predicted permease
MRIPAGVRRAFRLPTTSERIVRELDDEVRFHVEMRAKRLIEQGHSTESAYAEAMRRFGDVDDLRDYCVSIEVPHMQRVAFRERLSTIAQDFRFALRQFRKSPGFAFVAALTLALGVGATTAIFSVLYGVVLRPLPFPNPDRIVQIFGIDSKGQAMRNVADPTFDAIVSGNHSLSAVAEYKPSGSVTVILNNEPIRARTAAVSRDFFNVLGVHPAVGRDFAREEMQIGAAPAVVISYSFWQRQFAGSRSVIGSRVTIANESSTIIGVMPPGQEFPEGTEIFVSRERDGRSTSYTSHNWLVMARVRPGISLEQANQDVSSILRGVHERVGEATWTFDGRITRMRDQLVGRIKPMLYTLFAASAVLLLIACANVANLLIARMAVREGEIAVRIALGAGRARLGQQLLIETSLLAAVGCAGGLLLAFAGVKVLLALRPALVPRVSELSVDGSVLAFAVLISAATAIGLGLLAAWRGVRGDLRSALAQSQRTQGGGGASYRLRGSLVVMQIAMTTVLLIGASLLARSFMRLMSIDAGFRTKGLLIAELDFERREGAERIDPVALQTQDDMLARVRALPGVTSAGISDAAPFSGGSSNGTFLILDNSDVKIDAEALQMLFRDKSRTGMATYRIVDGGYFRALGIPLVSGRLLDDRDRQGAPHTAVISASLAKKQWPGQSALGRTIEFGNIDGDLTPITVVGVVGDTREQDLTAAPDENIYLSYRQRPRWDATRYLVIATNAETQTLTAVRQALHEMRPDVPLRLTPIEDVIARSIARQRFMLVLVGVFGVMALLLATLGVYSVISYLVAQRGKEISIRVALGARAPDILRLVLRQGVVLAIGGAMVGGVGAIAATRVLNELLYDVSATDPVAFGAVITMLCAIAAIASYVPARRAARTEPMDVLRAG